jgi:hypothetical protein
VGRGAIVAVGVIAVLGVGAAAYFLTRQAPPTTTPPPPSTTCAPGDIPANPDGSCMSGYIQDAASPGCCMPKPTPPPPPAPQVLTVTFTSDPTGQSQYLVNVAGGTASGPGTLYFGIPTSFGGSPTPSPSATQHFIFNAQGTYQTQLDAGTPGTYSAYAVDNTTGATSPVATLTVKSPGGNSPPKAPSTPAGWPWLTVSPPVPAIPS